MWWMPSAQTEEDIEQSAPLRLKQAQRSWLLYIFFRLCWWHRSCEREEKRKSLNEWMNFITYIPPVKPEGQAQECILRRSMAINPLGNDSPVRM